MKKKLLPILTVLFALLMVVFFCLWQKEARDQSEMINLCKSSAYNAGAAFSQYEESGSEASYQKGVCSYYTFMQGWLSLAADSGDNFPYLQFNRIYGQLLFDPEDCKTHLPELIDLMELLAEDPMDINGELRASELANELEYGE